MPYMGTGIAGFAVEAATGLLTPIGHAPTEASRRIRMGGSYSPPAPFDLVSN